LLVEASLIVMHRKPDSKTALEPAIEVNRMRIEVIDQSPIWREA
jgi:hypothetical protein